MATKKEKPSRRMVAKANGGAAGLNEDYSHTTTTEPECQP